MKWRIGRGNPKIMFRATGITTDHCGANLGLPQVVLEVTRAHQESFWVFAGIIEGHGMAGQSSRKAAAGTGHGQHTHTHIHVRTHARTPAELSAQDLYLCI